MDDILEILRQLIITRVGINYVFIGDLPSGSTDCVAIQNTLGNKPVSFFGGNTIREVPLTVLVRSQSFDYGSTMCDLVYSCLHRYTNRDNNILSVVNTQDAGYLGENSGTDYEWQIIFKMSLVNL